MTRTRWITAGTAALVLAGGAITACTVTQAGAGAEVPRAVRATAAEKACEGGMYAWFNVRRDWVLTGVGDVEKAGRGSSDLKDGIHRLYTPRTAVRSEGPALKGKDVLWSLAVHIGEVDADDAGSVDSYFTHVGRKAPAMDAGGRVTFEHSARVVRYALVKQVDADFRYSCSGGGKATTGHAVSWLVDGQGVLECSTPVGEKAHSPARDAARLACGAGSVAAKGSGKA